MTEITVLRPLAARATSGRCDGPTRAFGCRQLVVDPGERLLQANCERRAGLPAEALEYQRVVRIPAADALRSVEVVAPLQLHARDVLDDVDELVDRDELGRAEVDRLADVALHNLRRAVQAVVDVHEAPRLLPVAPDLDLVAAGELGLG